ncbi:MAG: DUF1934 domain-containing protein [Lachnospiraceae bacterium]
MQEKKKVIIELVGLQHMDGEHSETFSRVDGEYVIKNGTVYLIYQEKMEGTKDTKCTLKIKDPVISLTRRGEIIVSMIFEEGRSHKTGYITPYGTLPLEITTGEMKIEMKENGLEAIWKYRLDLDGRFLSDNEMHIKVFEK